MTTITQFALTAAEQRAVYRANQILNKYARKHPEFFTCCNHAKDYAFNTLSNRAHECFAVVYLDSQHRLIDVEIVFEGTIDSAAVYPRVVARKALEQNAAALILMHNHPSGIAEPSQADKAITKRLQDALALFDIRIIDHLVVGCSNGSVVSFAERGLI
ncbi:RadC family protein [Bowmanella sp. JS7-9]|uniref:RadC family protein n=1 Tax=Pseudobowmanella zhangzhouensis TaxID=1537679 RepID=A0ABW1XLK8_9ALTE|nr:DNA repair protein RadC [Bowmanella sp. JS7-9]